jgi:hypothetical protein
MERVETVKPLNMGWCLDCHRDPGPHLRPKDQITNMQWTPPDDRTAAGQDLKAKYHVNANTDCVTCHR